MSIPTKQLGVGTLASQDASNVAITGGSGTFTTLIATSPTGFPFQITGTGGQATLTGNDGGNNIGFELRRTAGTGQIYFDFSLDTTTDYHARFLFASTTLFRFQAPTSPGLTYQFDRPLVCAGPSSSSNFTIRGDSSGGEGGQLVLGYPGASPTGEAASTWNLDVDSINGFRIFRRNSSNTALNIFSSTEAGAISFPGLILNLNGSLQTTGTGAGSVSGNTRGTGATDLQVTRTAAAQVATGNYSAVLGGQNNTAGTDYSTVSGANAISRRVGERVHASGGSGNGDAQVCEGLLRVTTSDGTTTEATTPSRILIATSTCVTFIVKVAARRSGVAGEYGGWIFAGTIARDSAASSTQIVGSVTQIAANKTSAASAWSVTVDADTTNGALRVQVTGEASKTVVWAISYDLTERG